MKKTKVKVKKTKTPKTKAPRQKQKQQQNVDVKIHIDQSKKTKVKGGGSGGGDGGAKMIPSYQPQPISSYPLFREEEPQLPIIRNQVFTIGTTSMQEENTQTPIRPQFTRPKKIEEVTSPMNTYRTPMNYTPVSRESSFNPSPFKPAGIASYKSVEKDSDAFQERTPLPPQRERAKRRTFEELNPKEQAQSLKNKSIRETKKLIAEKESYLK